MQLSPGPDTFRRQDMAILLIVIKKTLLIAVEMLSMSMAYFAQGFLHLTERFSLTKRI